MKQIKEIIMNIRHQQPNAQACLPQETASIINH
jgi:hypothetical protein